jgi:hypothetical protein
MQRCAYGKINYSWAHSTNITEIVEEGFILWGWRQIALNVIMRGVYLPNLPLHRIIDNIKSMVVFCIQHILENTVSSTSWTHGLNGAEETNTADHDWLCVAETQLAVSEPTQSVCAHLLANAQQTGFLAAVVTRKWQRMQWPHSAVTC